MLRRPDVGRRLAVAGAALLLGLPAARAAAPDGFRYSRPVEVTEAGVVRVALAYDDVVSMLPAASDLRLFAADGRELPLDHELEPVEARRTPVRVTAIERRTEGWRILLDTVDEPAPHRALHFEIADSRLAAGARLAASAGGESWRLLAEGDLFRLGDEEALRGATLGYEPTSDRYLRLDWPQEAGFPEAERISLERAPAAPVARRVTRPECRRPAPGAVACRLRSAAPLARRLELELTGAGGVGYRLSLARQGHWQPIAEGSWLLEPGAVRSRVPRLGRLDEPAALRLELYGEPGEEPELAAYTFDHPPQSVFFRAATVGSYLLAWGGEPVQDGGRPALTNDPGLTREERRLAARIEPGPLREHPWPELPAAAVEPRAPLPEADFAASWQVRPPAAGRGAVVRLALPPSVLSVAGADLADLRLAVADRQVPFLVSWVDEPQPVLQGTRARPVASDEAGHSEATVELPASAIALSQLELTAPGGPFRRRARLRSLPGEPRRLGAPKWPRRWQTWMCLQETRLPCRLDLALGASPGAGRLELELDDGDNPPLGELQIDLWRRGAELAFVWPARGPVRLLAGNPELGGPDYDLALLRARLLRREPVTAELDLEAAAEQRAARERRGRLLLTAVLAVAALFLLYLLARMLKREPGGAG